MSVYIWFGKRKTTLIGACCLCDLYSKFRKFARIIFLFMRIYIVIVMLIRQDRQTTVFSNLRWTNLFWVNFSKVHRSKIYLQHRSLQYHNIHDIHEQIHIKAKQGAMLRTTPHCGPNILHGLIIDRTTLSSYSKRINTHLRKQWASQYIL